MPRSRHPVPKCYLAVAYAPAGVSAAEGNEAFNAYVADPGRGLVLNHDHFVDTVGGYAVFACSDPEEVRRLREAPELPGWSISIHPLAFSHNAMRWIYQVDFTLAVYRGQRLAQVYEAYLASEEYRHLNRQLADGDATSSDK